MKKLLAASLYSAVLTATTGIPAAFADEPSKLRFDKEQAQAEKIQPQISKRFAGRKDLGVICKHPVTDREMSKHECLAWISLILLRAVAPGGGGVPRAPTQSEEGSR